MIKGPALLPKGNRIKATSSWILLDTCSMLVPCCAESQVQADFRVAKSLRSDITRNPKSPPVLILHIPKPPEILSVKSTNCTLST